MTGDPDFEKLVLALNGIRDWRKANKGVNKTETVECPVCKGRLLLSIARSNSHVWGKCETLNCVQWIE